MEVAGKTPMGSIGDWVWVWSAYVHTDVLAGAYQGQKVRGDAMDATKGGSPKEAAAKLMLSGQQQGRSIADDYTAYSFWCGRCFLA